MYVGDENEKGRLVRRFELAALRQLCQDGETHVARLKRECKSLK